MISPTEPSNKSLHRRRAWGLSSRLSFFFIVLISARQVNSEFGLFLVESPR